MNNLQVKGFKVIEKDGLIKVYETNEGEKIVDARELHKGLSSKTQFKDWVVRRISECDAIENEDYIVWLKKEQNLKGGRPSKEYILKLDIAKEMAMLERNEIGKKYRRYFIEVEKKYKKILPKDYLSALKQLVTSEEQKQKLCLENKQQKQIIGELKPKADYVDTILKNKGLVTITQIAKDYGMSGRKMNGLLHKLGAQYKQSNQWLLYSKHHDKGYTHSMTVNITHKDGTPDVKMSTKWTQKGRLFLYDLLKENGVLPIIECKECKEFEEAK